MKKQKEYCIVGYKGIAGGFCIVFYDLQTGGLVRYEHYPASTYSEALVLAKSEYPELFNSGTVLDANTRWKKQRRSETNGHYMKRIVTAAAI